MHRSVGRVLLAAAVTSAGLAGALGASASTAVPRAPGVAPGTQLWGKLHHGSKDLNDNAAAVGLTPGASSWHPGRDRRRGGRGRPQR